MGVWLRGALVPVVLIAVLFGSAGRIDLPWFWAYAGVVLAATAAGPLFVDRELMRERLSPAPGGVDRRLRALASPFFFAYLRITGLDVGRFHWSDTVPTWLRVAGLCGLAFGFAVALWAMHVNPFFSPVVRIQTERGHRVISGGPYRFVRHPGYMAGLVMFPCGALVLGSWWSLAPLGVALLLVLRRIAIEDQYLHANLAGYAEYAGRVRYRLLPLLW